MGAGAPLRRNEMGCPMLRVVRSMGTPDNSDQATSLIRVSASHVSVTESDSSRPASPFAGCG